MIEEFMGIEKPFLNKKDEETNFFWRSYHYHDDSEAVQNLGL